MRLAGIFEKSFSSSSTFSSSSSSAHLGTKFINPENTLTATHLLTTIPSKAKVNKPSQKERLRAKKHQQKERK